VLARLDALCDVAERSRSGVVTKLVTGAFNVKFWDRPAEPLPETEEH
jgi:hypothetical protein